MRSKVDLEFTFKNPTYIPEAEPTTPAPAPTTPAPSTISPSTKSPSTKSTPPVKVCIVIHLYVFCIIFVMYLNLIVYSI